MRPVSSSLRKSTSSISSPICCTSLRACSTSSVGFAPGSEKLSSSTISRVSGVRSSCETAAVNPARSSSYAARSPGLLTYSSVSRLPPTSYGISSGARPSRARSTPSGSGAPSCRPSSASRARLLAASDSPILVEHDDDLAALLDQDAGPFGGDLHVGEFSAAVVVLSAPEEPCHRMFTVRSPIRSATGDYRRTGGKDPDRRGRRGHRPRNGRPPARGGVRSHRRRRGRGRARAAPLREPRRLRPRPDAARASTAGG